MGFRPTGNRSSFEPQTEELLHLCPLSRSSGASCSPSSGTQPGTMTINKSGSQGFWPYDLLSCVQDLCFGKIGLLSRLIKLRWLQKSLKRKTQMAFGLAGGLSKPDWCRLELYGWPLHSALVSEHCIGRGMDCWGSEIWTIAVDNAESKYNVFRLIRLFMSNWKTCSWYWCF